MTVGDHDDPLRGVVRIDSAEVIDVVVPRGRWQDDVLARRLDRVILEEDPVVDAADLILLKVDGGLIDLIDVECSSGTTRRSELSSRRASNSFRPHQAAWKEFLPARVCASSSGVGR